MDEATIPAIVSGIAGALATSGIVGILVNAAIKRRDREHEALKADVRELGERRMAQVEKKLERMETGGCSIGQKVLENLKAATGMLTKVDIKLDRIAETTARQAAEIQGNAHYIANVDKSLQRHKETAHHG